MTDSGATPFAVGQRWLSETETEQGLGMITQIQGRTLTLLFPATEEVRHYAAVAAPLARYQLFVDDVGTHADGWSFRVTEVINEGHLHRYQGIREDNQAEVTVTEPQLAANVATQHPLTRLLAGKLERTDLYQLRQQALRSRQAWQQSGVVGLTGVRAQLLPHQLYVAHEIAERSNPKVMLADEVGLGKTIEAGYIIQRRLLSGRSKRLLIIAPDALCHQWLVELQRRFGLSVSLFDQERCEQSGESEQHVFATEQRVLIPHSLLEHELWSDELIATEWDLVVIDEAHQLKPEQTGFAALQTLSASTDAVLMLTATPEQAGPDAHFARLQLLDPHRFHSFAGFQQEQQSYQALAQLADALYQQQPLSSDQLAQLSLKLERQLTAPASESDYAALLDELLDLHGTGRVMFRNSRAHVGGFPERQLHTYELSDMDKAEWLLQLLKANRSSKFVLICKSSAVAQDLAEYLRVRAGIHAALFNEQQSMIERDRAAAYFANPEDGCPLLICSELGSEGRNFQFSQNLVLFDLPEHPDLLEQRIGRLDRIGQTDTVHIHVPLITTSHDLIWFQWYQAMQAFTAPNAIGAALYDEQIETLRELLNQPQLSDAALTEFTQITATRAAELRAEVEAGRDRLQELNACRPTAANAIVEAIERFNDDLPVSDFMLPFWELFGLEFDQLNAETGWLRPTEHLRVPFPELPEEGITVTFSREYALVHEDVVFLSWDHPHVQHALELLTSDSYGSTCLGLLSNKALPAGTWFIEVTFSSELIAATTLAASEFYPAQPIRVLLDSKGRDLSDKVSPAALEQQMSYLDKKQARQIVKQLRSDVQQAILKAWQPALNQQQPRVAAAQQQVEKQLGAQQQRLQLLQRRNPAVTAADVDAIAERQQRIMTALQEPVLQLDSVRIIVNAP